jgi:PAS domain S-box-containing protein
MYVYSLLSLCASTLSLTLGVSVYYLNRKSVVNKLFMLTMIANGYWAFIDFMLSQTYSFETASLWSKALAFWPFLAALLLHFTLAFTESDLLKNKLTYVALYFPALLFSLIDLTTNWISAAPVLTAWGYTNTYTLSIVERAYGVWAAIMGLLVVFFFASHYTRVINKTKRLQTKFVAIGFGIPVFISLITDSIFPVIGFPFPVLGNISGSVTSFFVVYAMLKYELFGFRPEIAAENVFSAMLDSAILVNLQGVIVKVNRSLLEVSGCTEDEVIGQSLSKVVQDAGVMGKGKSPAEFIAEMRKQRELKNYEITFRSKTSKNRRGVLSCSMVTDNRGQDVGVAFVLHDVTELKELEQKLIKSERLASIGELAGILGHDLRNPLMGIRGASYYLKTKYADIIDSNDKEMFDSIDESINYSDKIVNDLIDYSSEIHLYLENVTPNALLKGALELMPPPQHVTVLDETEEVTSFKVDVDLMRRGFANIIKNAFDAMPNGGKLVISNQKIGEAVVFCFRDSGDGMTQETLAKLWTPLFTTKAKGMGFGLAICKRTVEAHGGKISCESILGEGTMVKVELPLNLHRQDNEPPMF